MPAVVGGPPALPSVVSVGNSFDHHPRTPCQQAGIGPCQGGQGLPQGSAGQQIAVAEGLSGIQQYQVEIAPQPHVLEPVIKNQDFGGKALGGQPSRTDAIPSHDNRYAERQ